MLKLIKHEWIHVSRTVGFAVLYLVVVTFLFTFVSNVDLSSIPFFGNVFSVLVSIVYGISISAVSLIAYISAGTRFSRTMYGDQGYLTQTLPYTKGQLVFAKGFVASCCVVIVNLVGFASVAFQVIVLSNNDMVRIFFDTDMDRFTLREFKRMCREELRVSFPVFVALVAAVLLVFLVLQMNAIYTAISVGQLWSRHPMVGTMLTYLVGSVLYIFATNYIGRIVDDAGGLDTFASTMVFFIAVNFVYAVITYLIPTLLLKYRLNMK